MRSACLTGVSRRRWKGCTRRNPKATPSDGLVERRFAVDGPDRLWVADITQHRTAEGWLYGAFVIDPYSRRVLGWALAGHCRTDLAVDTRGRSNSFTSLIPLGGQARTDELDIARVEDHARLRGTPSCIIVFGYGAEVAATRHHPQRRCLDSR